MPGTYDTVAWGEITGTLSNQNDLKQALDSKPALNHTHIVSDIDQLVIPVTKVNSMIGEVEVTWRETGAAPEDHTHDEDHYTQDETDAKFAFKEHQHEQADLDITFPVTKVNNKEGVVVLEPSDINAAPEDHNHDTIYYTKTVADDRFAYKSHDHRDLYYTQSYIRNNFLGKTDTAVDSNKLAGVDKRIYLNYAFAESGMDPDVERRPFTECRHTNGPTYSYYYFQTIRIDRTYDGCVQLAYSYLPTDTPEVWIRNKYHDDAWNEWCRIDNNENPKHTISTGAPSGGKAGDVWFTV